ncbi:hypothetical protein H6P1_00220 (plasmid) [Variovorax sp. PBL-H6]|nr:hypothetical protein H6P1_00220 [Variovorax sp. PBL-H6]
MTTARNLNLLTRDQRPSAPNLWPSRSTLNFTDGRGRPLHTSTNRRFDLSDGLMAHWPRASRIVYLGVSTKSPSWVTWTEEALREIERHIRYDLGFDGYGVTLTRLTPQRRRAQPCSTEFRWKLRIRNR